MKSVLISIQPKWVEKIVSGKKTIEVRKSRPKIETPFKCYIYCTKDKKDMFWVDKEIEDTDGLPKGLKAYNSYLGNSSVIGEFVCDRVEELHAYELEPCKKFYDLEKERLDLFLKESCLSYNEVCDYRKNLGYIKPLYGWHISNLKIYDKPKDLSEFSTYGYNSDYTVKDGSNYSRVIVNPLKRPPQSWCYVEVGE